MKAVVTHEYFNRLQFKNNNTNNLREYLRLGGDLDPLRWFWEGTARWFEDISVFDDLNTYLLKTPDRILKGGRILETGLNVNNPTPSQGGYLTRQDPYHRFTFFKLLHEKCPAFEMQFKELMQIDFGTDPSGIKQLLSGLEGANCNFGNHLGESKKASIEAALTYFQYATIHRDKISLLDENEPDAFNVFGYNFGGFDFQSTPYQFEKEDWFLSDVSSILQIRVDEIKELLPYSAYSLYIKGAVFDDIEADHEAVLRVKPVVLGAPFIVSLLNITDGNDVPHLCIWNKF